MFDQAGDTGEALEAAVGMGSRHRPRVARVEDLHEVPGFITCQFGQEQVIRLHPQRGRHQLLRPHLAAVQQVDMVRVQRQLQLVYFLDGDQPALNGIQVDQRLPEGRLA
ncbi:hypothetical protein D9M71_575530 [compost metagenome]